MILGDYFSNEDFDDATGIFDRNMMKFRFDQKFQVSPFIDFHQAFSHTIFDHQDNDLLLGYNNSLTERYDKYLTSVE